MTTLSDGAEALRLAMILRAASIDDVVEWADNEIELCDSPPIALIEISMGRSLPAPNILAYLTELVTDANSILPMRAALGMLATKIVHEELDAESVILDVYSLLKTEGLVYDYPFVVFCNLETELALIRDGILGDDRLSQLRSDTLDELWNIANQTKDAG